MAAKFRVGEKVNYLGCYDADALFIITNCSTTFNGNSFHYNIKRVDGKNTASGLSENELSLPYQYKIGDKVTIDGSYIEYAIVSKQRIIDTNTFEPIEQYKLFPEETYGSKRVHHNHWVNATDLKKFIEPEYKYNVGDIVAVKPMKQIHYRIIKRYTIGNNN